MTFSARIFLTLLILFALSSLSFRYSTALAGTKAVERLVMIKLRVPEKYRIGPFKEERTLSVPQGFKISVFAAGLGGARFMAVGPGGTIYLSVPSKGEIMALPDKDRDGVADSHVVFAEGLSRPHGVAFIGKDLVVAETGSLLLLRDTDSDMSADVKKTISEDLPPGGGHWTRTVIAGPDNMLYVSAGSSCNVCLEKDPRRAAVMRFHTDGDKGEIFATGLRNSVGIAFHPDTKELWGVDNGRDLLGDDLPPEEVNRIQKGGDYGWPYCYGSMVPDPDFGSPERCAKTLPPVVEMQAHSAPLGIAFGKGLKFPKEYGGVLFIAFHGSWNRTIPTGYKLVGVRFMNGKPAGGPFDFITGWLTEDGPWGRPVAPVVGSDGALYLSDDHAGAVYRITYEK